MPPPEAVPVLMDVITGRVPLRMQARQQNDIMSAIRLADEFGLGRGDSPWPFILEEGTEAYQCIPALKAHNIPVVYGPIFMTPRGFRARTGETDGARLNAAKQLLDAGLTVALTANDMRDEEGLVRQAMMAVRYGLTPEQALRAVTETPAKLLGLGDSIGTLAKGGDADLVVWNADPFSGAGRAELVMIGGQVVYRDK
jgi:imidazolonepropionase-like amidohydrolase